MLNKQFAVFEKKKKKKKNNLCYILTGTTKVLSILNPFPAENLCNHFGPKSGPIQHQALSGSKLYDTTDYF